MENKLKIISLIPARGGSKGVPRKNIRLLAGKPLIAYSIEQSKASKLIDKTFVVTDDDEIASIAKKYGAEIIKEPAELAGDRCLLDPVLQHAVKSIEEKGYKPDFIVLLQPTCPLRKKDDVNNAVKKLLETKADSLVGVYDFFPYFLWDEKDGLAISLNYNPEKRPLRQEKKIYRENGSIYIVKRDILMKKTCRLGGKIAMYIMDEDSSLDIDTEFSLWLVEQFIKKKEEK